MELYIEGQEPHVIVSGENLDLSKEEVRSLAQQYVSKHALLDNPLMNGASMHVPGWIICDRFTRIWFARLPYESVVGRIGADCSGHFSWVQLTGSLSIADEGIKEWEYDSAYGKLHRSADVDLLTTPRARCYSYDSEVWVGRNDMLVTFHSGTTKYFDTWETAWTLIDCDV